MKNVNLFSQIIDIFRMCTYNRNDQNSQQFMIFPFRSIEKNRIGKIQAQAKHHSVISDVDAPAQQMQPKHN